MITCKKSAQILQLGVTSSVGLLLVFGIHRQIGADTLTLSSGRKLENVRVSLRGETVIVLHESGRQEKFEKAQLTFWKRSPVSWRRTPSALKQPPWLFLVDLLSPSRRSIVGLSAKSFWNGPTLRLGAQDASSPKPGVLALKNAATASLFMRDFLAYARFRRPELVPGAPAAHLVFYFQGDGFGISISLSATPPAIKLFQARPEDKTTFGFVETLPLPPLQEHNRLQVVSVFPRVMVRLNGRLILSRDLELPMRPGNLELLVTGLHVDMTEWFVLSPLPIHSQEKDVSIALTGRGQLLAELRSRAPEWDRDRVLDLLDDYAVIRARNEDPE